MDCVGVIEGFYGRPWHASSRALLVSQLPSLSLSVYVYSPKDDLKLRTFWRDRYTESEARSLRDLIALCDSQGVVFVYAISPGLDMCFSDPADCRALVNKFKSVAELGCESFAVFFDDIPKDMSESDKEHFASFAHAQCSVANMVRKELSHIVGDSGLFLFCPTVYCSMMAEPDAAGGSGAEVPASAHEAAAAATATTTSEGKESSHVLAQCGYLRTVGELLDPKFRICWTGPQIISETITPEHIAEVTAVLRRKPLIWDNLWANDYDQRRLYLGPFKGRHNALLRDQLVSGIIVNPNNEFEVLPVPLGTFAMYVRAASNPNPAASYDAEAAHKRAIDVWSGAFVSIHDDSAPAKPRGGHPHDNHHHHHHETGEDDDDDDDDDDDEMTGHGKHSHSHHHDHDDHDGDGSDDGGKHGHGGQKSKKPQAGEKLDLELLCHLFYLPYEHGPRAQRLLDSAKRLSLLASGADEAPIDAFIDDAQQVVKLFEALLNIRDRSLLYTLYPYLWGIKEEALMLIGYAEHLAARQDPCERYSNGYYVHGTYRGGIVADLQRLFEFRSDASSDIVPAAAAEKKPPTSSSRAAAVCAVIRAAQPEDRDAAYRVCVETGDSGADGTHLYVEDPMILGHRYTGPYLYFHPELSFVLEDDQGVIGYTLAALDSTEFYRRYREEWLPKVQGEYKAQQIACTAALGSKRTIVQRLRDELLYPEEHARSLEAEQKERGEAPGTVLAPPDLFEMYPSHLHIDIIGRGQKHGFGSKMIKVLLNELRRRKSRGVHLEMATVNTGAMVFYKKLGFSILAQNHEDTIMGLKF